MFRASRSRPYRHPYLRFRNHARILATGRCAWDVQDTISVGGTFGGSGNLLVSINLGVTVQATVAESLAFTRAGNGICTLGVSAIHIVSAVCSHRERHGYRGRRVITF